MDNKQVITLCFNEKGEKIDPADLKLNTQQESNNVINFCCTTVVPDGFVLELDLNQLGFCVDFSELSCCLETRETTCELLNPSNDGILTCPVEIQAVRLVGCARLYGSAGPILPVSGFSFPETDICKISCEITTCVNQIIGFTCGKNPPCEPCFKQDGFLMTFTITTDNCGRQILIVSGDVNIKFTGCDCSVSLDCLSNNLE